MNIVLDIFCSKHKIYQIVVKKPDKICESNNSVVLSRNHYYLSSFNFRPWWLKSGTWVRTFWTWAVTWSRARGRGPWTWAWPWSRKTSSTSLQIFLIGSVKNMDIMEVWKTLKHNKNHLILKQCCHDIFLYIEHNFSVITKFHVSKCFLYIFFIY